jgi:hypothetical protein
MIDHEQADAPVAGAGATYPRRQFLVYEQVICGSPATPEDATPGSADGPDEHLTFADWFRELDRDLT